LGGSEYFAQLGLLGRSVPRVEPARAREWYRALHRAIRQGWVRSAHDCSDGGLAVALVESAFAGGHGLELDLRPLVETTRLRADELLFSESPSRLVLTLSPGRIEAFESLMTGLPCHYLGEVTAAPRLRITSGPGDPWLDLPLDALKEAWQATLREL
jgi:phosphoribosylformylglycinamidine synthase